MRKSKRERAEVPRLPPGRYEAPGRAIRDRAGVLTAQALSGFARHGRGIAVVGAQLQPVTYLRLASARRYQHFRQLAIEAGRYNPAAEALVLRIVPGGHVVLFKVTQRLGHPTHV